MARFSRVYAGFRPLRCGADTARLGAIRLDLGSGSGLLPKRLTLAPLAARGQPRSVVAPQRAAHDRELTTQAKDLELLGLLTAKEQHGELQDAPQRPVEEGDDQKLGALG